MIDDDFDIQAGGPGLTLAETFERYGPLEGALAWTGHRPNKLGGYGPSPTQTRVRAWIRDVIQTRKPKVNIVGTALGLDQWVAEECLELNSPFVAAVPFKGQERMWPSKSQDHYRYLLSRAASTRVVCDGGYAPWKMQRRNEWMVNAAPELAVVWDGTSGGTANCVRYAESKGRVLHRFDPRLVTP